MNRINYIILALGYFILDMFTAKAFAHGTEGISIDQLREQIIARGAPKDWQLGLPEPFTPLAENMLWFHNSLLLPIIYAIGLLVMVLMIYIFFRFNSKRNKVISQVTHHPILEVVWTIIPVLILLAIFVPSMRLLKASAFLPGEADVVVNVIGNQWYWTYEFVDEENYSYDSIMLDEETARSKNRPFLMSVDYPLVLPVGKTIQFLITSNDVLHSFAATPLGVRMDAVPGQINEAWAKIELPGIYYGFCSELCGKDHSYMPIEIIVLPEHEYEDWYEQLKADNVANPLDALGY